MNQVQSQGESPSRLLTLKEVIALGVGTMALYAYTFDVYGSAINATLFGAMAGLAGLKTAGLNSRGGYAW